MIDLISQLSPEAAKNAADMKTAWRPSQAAPVLSRSANAIYSDVAKGRIKAIRIGGKLFIPQAEIERLLLGARSPV